MTHKEATMASLVQRASFALTLVFLLRTSAAELETPESPAVNMTTMSLVFGVSQQRGNTSDERAAPVREPKARKVYSYQNVSITTSTDLPISLAVHSASAANDSVSAKTTILPRVMTASVNRRSTPHRKYPNRHHHHHSDSHQSESEDKRKIYVNSEDYSEQQYQQDYYVPQTQEYEDPYNTIPVEQSLTGLDGIIADPYYQPYAPQDPGYFGPPIPGRPVHEEPPYDVHSRGCRCPEVRQMQCNNTSAEFLALAGSLGGNLWALVSLIATSSLPFLLPVLIIKLILVPIGIFKFLALIKMFFKLFIVLPFLVRHIYPAFVQNFNLHDLLFQKIQDVAAHVHDHDILHPHSEDVESRTNLNASTAFRSTIFNGTNDTSIWDLRGCPSRVACELGAFLSNSTYANFPQKLANYLSKRADRVEARSRSDQTSESNDVDYEDEDEEQERIQQRDQAFKAFVVALGKKWTQEQCVIYACSVLF